MSSPCQRLLRAGASALSDAELVAVVAGLGVDASGAVISRCGDLRRLSMADPGELLDGRHVGPAGASRLLAAFELAARSAAPPSGRVLGSPRAIADVAAPLLARERRESLVVLVADGAHRLVRVVTVARGAADACPMPVREVLQAVLRHDGRAFALAHNHPSADPTPSLRDRTATDAVARAAAQVGLRFLDHVVIGAGSWRSVR